MKFLLTILIISVTSSAFAAPQGKDELRTSNRDVIGDIQAKLAAMGGCHVNVCFALDGSGSVTSNQFRNQINFAMDVVQATSGNDVKCAAVQYGLFNRPISFLTDDKETFIENLDAAEFAGASRTSVGAGIVWCHRQLSRKDGDNNVNKIVVLGDGRNNLGGSPARRARRFRNTTGGKVCVIEIGRNANRQGLLNIVGGDPSLILRVRDYLELTEILEECVEAICGISLF